MENNKKFNKRRGGETLRHKLIRLMNFLDEEFSYKEYVEGEWDQGDNSEELKIIYKIVLRIIENELTPLQRKCMIEYFINDKNMVEISEDMGINISGVSRHIQKSKRIILKLLKYSKVVDRYVSASNEDGKKSRKTRKTSVKSNEKYGEKT